MSTIRVHDLSTNEIIDRDMNADEIKAAKVLSAESIAAMETAKTKAAAKAALLTRLGITADEAALLLA
jgi:hypothetical protein